MSGIGLSELTDALIITTSEETGVISLTEEGNITRYLTVESLEERLFSLYKSNARVKIGHLISPWYWIKNRKKILSR